MSQTTLIIIFGLISWFLYSLNKRLSNVEESKGQGFTWAFSIYVLRSALKNKFLGNLLNIKSLEEGKEYKDWSKKDKDLWLEKYSADISEKCYLWVTYLSNENCFFIKNKKNSAIILKDIGKTLLYSEVLAGDENGIDDRLIFEIYERIVEIMGTRQPVITACLTEHYKDFMTKPKNYVLFDFPYVRNDMTDEKFKDLGFEVDRMEGDYIGEDKFGDHSVFPDRVTLKKNGSEISF